MLNTLPCTYYPGANRPAESRDLIALPSTTLHYNTVLAPKGFTLAVERLSTGDLVFYISHDEVGEDYFVHILSPTEAIDDIFLQQNLEILTAERLDTWLENRNEEAADRASGIPPEYNEN